MSIVDDLKKDKLVHETVYEAGSPLAKPMSFLKETLQELKQARELAVRLAIRNIKGQYSQAYLGLLWAVFPAAVTAIVFVYLRTANVLSSHSVSSSNNVSYGLYILSGIVLWQTFIEAVNSPTTAVATSKSMLVKLNFPRSAIVLSGLLEVGFNFLVKQTLLIGGLIWFHYPPTFSMLLYPLAALCLFAFGVGIGLFFAPMGFLYNDFHRVLQIILYLWFFLTPVVYYLPQGQGNLALLNYNPVTHLLNMSRDLFLGLPIDFSTPLIALIAFSWLSTILGLLFFRVALPRVIERLGS